VVQARALLGIGWAGTVSAAETTPV